MGMFQPRATSGEKYRGTEDWSSDEDVEAIYDHTDSSPVPVAVGSPA